MIRDEIHSSRAGATLTILNTLAFLNRPLLALI